MDAKTAIFSGFAQENTRPPEEVLRALLPAFCRNKSLFHQHHYGIAKAVGNVRNHGVPLIKPLGES